MSAVAWAPVGQTPTDKELRQQAGTPWPLFDRLNDEYALTVDACAVGHNAKLPKFWSPEDDGLVQAWEKHRVWCNPPYDFIDPWTARGLRSCLWGGFSVFLLPARTGRPWWFEHVRRAEVHWLIGRIQHIEPPGVEYSQPSGFSAVVVFDPATLDRGVVRYRHAESGEYISSLSGGEVVG